MLTKSRKDLKKAIADLYGAVNGEGAYPLNFGLDFRPGATATINFSNYDAFEEKPVCAGDV